MTTIRSPDDSTGDAAMTSSSGGGTFSLAVMPRTGTGTKQVVVTATPSAAGIVPAVPDNGHEDVDKGISWSEANATAVPDHHREPDAHGIAVVGGAWAGDHGVGQRLHDAIPDGRPDVRVSGDDVGNGRRGTSHRGEHGRDVPLHGQGAVQRGDGRRGRPVRIGTKTWTATETSGPVAAARRPRPASASRSGRSR